MLALISRGSHCVIIKHVRNCKKEDAIERGIHAGTRRVVKRENDTIPEMHNRDSLDIAFFLTLWMDLCFAFPGGSQFTKLRLRQIPPPDSFSVRSNGLIASTLRASKARLS
jgi:hypothetical protein